MIGKVITCILEPMLVPVFKLLAVEEAKWSKIGALLYISIFLWIFTRNILGLIFVYFYFLEDSD